MTSLTAFGHPAGPASRTFARSAGLGLALVLLVAVAAPTVTLAANSLGLTATYSVRANLSYSAATLAVTTTATVTNNTASARSALSFNLAPLRTGVGTTIGTTSVGGATVTPAISDQTLTISLPAALAPGSTVAVVIRYSSHLRTDGQGSDWMFTKLNHIIGAYRWIPWLSRPIAFNRPNSGDPFETAVSRSVSVAVTADRTLTFGTTGHQTSVSGLTYNFTASNVRDFNFAASPYYHVASGWAGAVKVRVLYNALPSSTLLTYAIKSINTYTSELGTYAYSQFTVAETGGGFAMESPGLIWIPYNAGGTLLPYRIAHETAHQWFYGMIGSDQALQPFADEAPADFLARNMLGLRRASGCATDYLDKSIYDYGSYCYYEVIYIQGGNYINAYRVHIGNARFWQGMRNYFNKYKFGIGGTRQFWAELDAAAGPLATSHADRFPSLYP